MTDPSEVKADWIRRFGEQLPYAGKAKLPVSRQCELLGLPRTSRYYEKKQSDRKREYRNRRIGEFLKEIELSEKRATGITKILNALKANGSPPPEFESNDNRGYMITTLKIHTGFDYNELPAISMYDNPTDDQKNILTPSKRPPKARFPTRAFGGL